MQTISESPLEKLRGMVLASEAKAKSGVIQDQMKAAAVKLQQAEAKVQAATVEHYSRSRDITRDIQGVESEERTLAELTKRLARLSASEREAGSPLIEESRRDIAARREALESEKSRLVANLTEAKIEAKRLLAEYEALVQECETLKLDPGAAARDAETSAEALRGYSLDFQIRKVAREIEDAVLPFAELTKWEQKAQLKIWLGTIRNYQEACEAFAIAKNDPLSVSLDAAFRTLTSLSKEHTPGYILEFRRENKPPQGNWQDYIADAKVELERAAARATKVGRRNDSWHSSFMSAMMGEREARVVDEAECIDAIRDAIVGENGVLDDGFRDAVHRALLALGADNAVLLEIISPFVDAIDGDPRFTSLVRRVALAAPREDARVPDDILAVTKGKRCIIVGGQAKGTARATLEEAFQFGSLEWIGTSGAPAASLVERCRRGSLDYVLLLRGFISHAVSESLIPACKGTRTRIVMVNRGYGVAQIVDAFRSVTF